MENVRFFLIEDIKLCALGIILTTFKIYGGTEYIHVLIKLLNPTT